MTIRFEKVAGGFAQRAFDIDLGREISDADRRAITAAWLDAGVLVFRGAGGDVDGHMRLSRCFGTLEEAVNKDYNLDGNPYLLSLKYQPGDAGGSRNAVDYRGEPRAGFIGWHWDQAFAPRIIRGAVLRMMVKPARHGETGFIDAIDAYDRLPPRLRERIEDLEVVYQLRADPNPISFPAGVINQYAGRDDAAMRAQFPPTVHPMIIRHPDSGRKVLKLSPMYADHILGMAAEESQALFAEIAEYLLDERYAYYHRWEVDDLVVWDNWRVLHSACGVPRDCARHVLRTTIAGDYALGRYLDPALERDFAAATMID